MLQDSPVGYELSENDHRIFTAFSPGKPCTLFKPSQAKSGSRTDLFDTSKPVDVQIKDLKEHVFRLERELRSSEQRSLEMLRKMSFNNEGSTKNLVKGNSPFHRSNASFHTAIGGPAGVADDSLLMSEKRAFKKSISSKLPMLTPSKNESGH